jgi:hypothetical protein
MSPLTLPSLTRRLCVLMLAVLGCLAVATTPALARGGGSGSGGGGGGSGAS